MGNSGFCIGDSNGNYTRWGKDGALNIKGSIYKMLQEGVLPGYGHIKVGIDYTGKPYIWRGMTLNKFYWRNVSRKEAELVSDALKSEAGELTTTDFRPDKVEEILKRVQIESSPASP